MDSNTASLITTQVGAAAASSYILNFVQRWRKIPWVTSHTAGINMVIRGALALVATIGISWQWNAADHTLLISGLSLMAILHGCWSWFTQYAMTHGFGSLFDAAQAKPVAEAMGVSQDQPVQKP